MEHQMPCQHERRRAKSNPPKRRPVVDFSELRDREKPGTLDAAGDLREFQERAPRHDADMGCD